MAQETMNRMIGRALIDRRFREGLLRSPQKATRGLPFTRQERELIASVRATSLEEFSRELTERLPEPRRIRRHTEASWRSQAVEHAQPVAHPVAEGVAVPRRRSSPVQKAKVGLALLPFSARLILRTLAAFLAIGTLTAVVARASEAVPSGEGVGAANGYVVSGIEYGLSAADPTRVDSITFGLTSARGNGIPRQVTVSVDGGVHWSPCLHTSGSRWTCSAYTSVRQVSSLRVVAVQ